MHRIGYLIPEFPGQTHIFFWRERQELMRLGITPEFVSTRRPPPGIVSHAWSDDAIRETTYLYPPKATELAATISALTRSIPVGFAKAVTAIARAQDFDRPAPWRLRLRLGGLMMAGASLAALAKARSWEHIHCHSCADAANIAMFAHLLSGIPYSITLHGDLATYGPNQREKWRHASLGIVITQVLRNFVERELSGSLPPRLEVAPMGVDLKRFQRRGAYQGWQGQGSLRIFSCARLNPSKGHIDLIQALPIIHRAGIDARLVIAGEDDDGGTGYRAILESDIERLGMREFVTLLGAVDEDRVVAELEHAHLFALASHAEPLGVAIMEAMAMELPVVVTGAGGVRELVHDGVDGLLVGVQKPESVAETIIRLARDPALALELGRRARATIDARFQSSRSAEVLAKHVLGNAASP